MTIDENSYYLNQYLDYLDRQDILLEEEIMNNEITPLEASGYSFDDVVRLAREIFVGEDISNMSIQTLRKVLIS